MRTKTIESRDLNWYPIISQSDSVANQSCCMTPCWAWFDFPTFLNLFNSLKFDPHPLSSKLMPSSEHRFAQFAKHFDFYWISRGLGQQGVRLSGVRSTLLEKNGENLSLNEYLLMGWR